ncbi:uracil-DNA glycosylase family protein [Demequina aurantiaca]|uniref:uracil-DNA glycosylase family protein n=1 Tax=Demequina aurantiaca TaxID=676200 RepID=UPI001F27444D|nr:uracil-DNA glycosylase family protein [Demequina aurantiaca]
MTERGWQPLFTAHPDARIAIVGQAPGRHAQASGIPWDDRSGRNLVDWLGVTLTQLRDPSLFSVLPMDFYFPGKGPSGDAAPRRGFASRWHPPLLAAMPDVSLTLLVGAYAQAHYLRDARKRTLTATVHDFREYLPTYFPLVHPSPLNFRWQARNEWFATDVLPELRVLVAQVLGR